MTNEKNFWDKIVKVLYIGLILFICLLFMLILFSTKGHCASASGLKLPVVVDNIDVSPYQLYINNTYGGFWDLTQDNVIGWGSQENGYYVQTFAVPQVPNQTASYFTISPPLIELSYPDFDYHNNTLTLTFENLGNDNYKPWRLMTFYSNGTGPNYPYSTAFNQSSTINKGVYGNTGATLNYVSSNIYLVKNGAYVVNMPVFVNEIPVIPIEPDDVATPDMEQPDISDYIPSWDNAPTFDNTDVLSALTSIYNLNKWVGEKTRDTLSGIASYIGDLLRWAIQRVIDNIRTKIDEIKGIINDIKGFISDIKAYIEYIKEPLDVSVVQTTITNSSAYGDITSITGAFSSFKSVFDNTNEPQTYTIPIHLENITILHQTSPQYIDLSVILPVRNLIRTFCWVVITFSLFVTVVDAIPNYLKGGDE